MKELAIRERPILYSGAMVRAILKGQKTQTRRVFKMPSDLYWYEELGGESAGQVAEDMGNGCWHLSELSCPHGSVGDRLWVRETFALSVRDPQGLPPEDDPSNWDLVYRADKGDSGQWSDNIRTPEGKWTSVAIKAPWKPSIFMPRWASRITLEITDVRVEQIQHISGADMILEGVDEYARSLGLAGSARVHWIHLWESINSKRDNGIYAWNRNPWVWVITFKRV